MENSIISRMQSFKDWFHGYEDHFVVIGGGACSLIMEEIGSDFRATRDIDIVLLIESLNADFGRRFWDYVLDAGYAYCQKSTGKPQYYRFYKPKSKDYPEMIELFSRSANGLSLPEDAVITPIPISEDVSSLSAILLGNDYYNFLRDGIRKIDGIPVLDELHIIPFKAKAWLDLTGQRNSGGTVHRNDINKHRRDIYRLATIVAPGYKFTLPQAIERDMRTYISEVQAFLMNIAPKERDAERAGLEKITMFYGISHTLLKWK